MDTYKLIDLKATVGMFGDFSNFKDVIDYVFETNPYKKALNMFGFDDVQDLSEALTDEHGIFREDLAEDLCMDCLNGVEADEEDLEDEWGDEMYDRAAGK